jgi:hypothetical protein
MGKSTWSAVILGKKSLDGGSGTLVSNDWCRRVRNCFHGQT